MGGSDGVTGVSTEGLRRGLTKVQPRGFSSVWWERSMCGEKNLKDIRFHEKLFSF